MPLSAVEEMWKRRQLIGHSAHVLHTHTRLLSLHVLTPRSAPLPTYTPISGAHASYTPPTYPPTYLLLLILSSTQATSASNASEMQAASRMQTLRSTHDHAMDQMRTHIEVAKGRAETAEARVGELEAQLKLAEAAAKAAGAGGEGKGAGAGGSGVADSPNCPNRTNPHHTCTSFCVGQFGGTMGEGTAGGNAAGNAAGRQAIGDGAGGGAGATSKTAACGETATATLVPASVAAARALFSTMDGNVATDRGIKAALFSAAAQVLDGSLVLDKATVIAEGGAKRTQLMEMGREWPNTEFGGLLGAIVDAE